MSDIVSNQETGLACLIKLIIIIISLFLSLRNEHLIVALDISLGTFLFIIKISNICKKNVANSVLFCIIYSDQGFFFNV